MIGLSVLSLSCGNSIASRVDSSVPAQYGRSEFPLRNFAPESQADDVSFLTHWSDGGSRYLVAYKRADKDSGSIVFFLRLSIDAGETFGREYRLSEVFSGFKKSSGISFHFANNFISAVLFDEGRIYYYQSNNGIDGFSNPVRINDSDTAVNYPPTFAAVDERTLVAAWTDKRALPARIYSSFSEDNGRTWSTDVPIDGAIGLREQERVEIAVGGDKRVHAVWTDWRDESTLADIRYSSSDDLGRSWNKSIKLNDDDLGVWQIEPQIVANGDEIGVVFSDFREEGEFGDRDWNIYAALSSNGGETWQKNIRINKEQNGRQGASQIVQLDNGSYAVSYYSTEKSIFGQHVLAVSAEGLRAFDSTAEITNTKSPTMPGWSQLVALRGGRVAALVYENSYTSNRKTIIYLEPDGEVSTGEKETATDRITKIPFVPGKVLFSDDFSGSAASQWSSRFGVWKIEKGAYVGLNTSIAEKGRRLTRFLSFADFEEPSEYVMKGKFLMDEDSHRTANIYFRSGPKREFVISNQFRHGSWLAAQDSGNEADENMVNGGIWTQDHLAQKAYSFRSGKWYSFELVVTNEQIDYSVDGDHYFSFRPSKMLSPSLIGLGGHLNSPAHFDDITISEVRK